MGTKMEVMERTMKRTEVKRKEEEKEEGEEGRGIYRQPAGADAVPNQEVTPDRPKEEGGMDWTPLSSETAFF